MSKQAKKGLLPELRFPKFKKRGEWEEVPFARVVTVHKGKGIAKADITPDGKLPCIRYGELYTRYGEVIDEVFSRTNVDPTELFLSEAGDVIIPASGETKEDIATASCVLHDGVALGSDLNVLRSEANGAFLSYYINHSKKRAIANVAQGDAVVHLYPHQLNKLSLTLPKPDEQKEIAACLASLDVLLVAERMKLDALREHKKGLMQQLFPAEGTKVPALRFPGFGGEWKEKALGQLFTIGSGKDYKHLGQGDIPVYGTGGYMLSVDDFLYDGESACIGRKGTIDKPVLLSGKFWTVDTLFYTHSFQNCSPKFVYLIFQMINWLRYNEAGGVPSLSKTIIEDIRTMVPSPDEQDRITSCLFSLDDSVTLQAERVTVLEEHKKGLMQGLFPSIN